MRRRRLWCGRLHDAGPAGQGQGDDQNGRRDRVGDVCCLEETPAGLFSWVRTSATLLPIPCGQPRDSSCKLQEVMREKLGFG
jgi:hypothetical protein